MYTVVFHAVEFVLANYLEQRPHQDLDGDDFIEDMPERGWKKHQSLKRRRQVFHRH